MRRANGWPPNGTDRDEPVIAHVVPVNGRRLLDEQTPVRGDGDVGGSAPIVDKPHVERPAIRLPRKVMPGGDNRNQLATNEPPRVAPRTVRDVGGRR
jgi:hypothetical protein